MTDIVVDSRPIQITTDTGTVVRTGGVTTITGSGGSSTAAAGRYIDAFVAAPFADQAGVLATPNSTPSDQLIYIYNGTVGLIMYGGSPDGGTTAGLPTLASFQPTEHEAYFSRYCYDYISGFESYAPSLWRVENTDTGNPIRQTISGLIEADVYDSAAVTPTNVYTTHTPGPGGKVILGVGNNPTNCGLWTVQSDGTLGDRENIYAKEYEGHAIFSVYDVDMSSPGYRRIYTGDGSTWGDVLIGSAGGGTVDVVSNVAANTILGRVTSGSGNSEELTASQVRTLLGLVVGTDVQAYDAELAAIAGLTSAADKVPYFTGSGTAALADLSAAGRALIDDADAAAQRTTLGLGTAATSASSAFATAAQGATADAALAKASNLSDLTNAATARTNLGVAIGTNVQAYDAELAAIAGLTSAADKVPYFTGSGTAAVADFTSAGRALVDDASASAQRATLGLASWVPQTASSTQHWGLLAMASAVNGTPTLTKDRWEYTLAFTPFPITLTAAQVRVSTAVASSNVRFGAYAVDSSRQATGAPLFDSGALSSATTGYKTVTGLSVTIPAGWFLWAINVDTAGVAVAGGSLSFPFDEIDTSSTPALTARRAGTATYGALPTTGPAWSISTSSSAPGSVPLFMAKWTVA